MCEYDSAPLWRPLPPRETCGWKRSYAKSAGGIVFVSPAPSLPRPWGNCFNVDSRAVCPDVGLLDMKSPQRSTELHPISSLDFVEYAVTWTEQCFLSFSYTGIQEGTQCTKCKNEWALKTSIALLYVLCTLLTIAVAVLGYKGKNKRHYCFTFLPLTFN